MRARDARLERDGIQESAINIANWLRSYSEALMDYQIEVDQQLKQLKATD